MQEKSIDYPKERAERDFFFFLLPLFALKKREQIAIRKQTKFCQFSRVLHSQKDGDSNSCYNLSFNAFV